MAGDALAAVEALDGAGSQSEVELTPDQGVRCRVVVPVDFDVVVDVQARTLPLGEDVRAGGQRAQRRLVDLVEVRAPRPGELPERAGAEPVEQLDDRGVELGQREERAMAKGGQYPPLDDLNGHFRLRLILRIDNLLFASVLPPVTRPAGCPAPLSSDRR